MSKGLLSINMKLGLFLIVLIFLCGEALSFVTISMDELEKKESLYYKVGSSEPFSGFVVDFYPNQQKKFKIKFSKGLKLSSSGWFEDGELSYTEKYDEGKLVEYIPTRNYDIKEIAEIYTVIPTIETCAYVLRNEEFNKEKTLQQVPCEEFFLNNKLREELYPNQKLKLVTGKIISIDEDTKKIRIENVKYGKTHGEILQTKNDRQTYYAFYENGVFLRSIVFDDSGNKETEINVLSNGRERKFYNKEGIYYLRSFYNFNEKTLEYFDPILGVAPTGYFETKWGLNTNKFYLINGFVEGKFINMLGANWLDILFYKNGKKNGLNFIFMFVDNKTQYPVFIDYYKEGEIKIKYSVAGLRLEFEKVYNNDLQHGFEYYFQNIKSISQPPTSKTCYQKGIEAKNEFCDINYLLELRNSIRKLVFTPEGQLKESAVNLYKEILNEFLEKL